MFTFSLSMTTSKNSTVQIQNKTIVEDVPVIALISFGARLGDSRATNSKPTAQTNKIRALTGSYVVVVQNLADSYKFFWIIFH